MTNLTDLFPAVPTYTPAMMQFDGSTGYYNKASLTTVGNKVSFVARFKHASFLGAAKEQRIIGLYDSSYRGLVTSYSSDYTTTARRSLLSLIVQNSAGSTVCRVFANIAVDDNNTHTLLASYDGDAGEATMVLDGVDVLDTGHAEHTLTTGTLETGSMSAEVGRFNAGSEYLGDIGFVGYRDAYLTNWSDFFYTDGSPRQLDTIGWTQWNAGTFQTPMMTFDGSTGYYTKTQATSGNKVTLVARFNLIENPSGTGAQYVVRSSGNTTDSRAAIILSDGNHATPAVRNTINFLAWNSAGAIICRLFSTEGVNMADTLVTVFASFDGDTGTGVMRVNGVSEDATHSSRVAPTTGTMDTGSATQSVGANWDGSLSSN